MINSETVQRKTRRLSTSQKPKDITRFREWEIKLGTKTFSHSQHSDQSVIRGCELGIHRNYYLVQRDQK